MCTQKLRQQQTEIAADALIAVRLSLGAFTQNLLKVILKQREIPHVQNSRQPTQVVCQRIVVDGEFDVQKLRLNVVLSVRNGVLRIGMDQKHPVIRQSVSTAVDQNFTTAFEHGNNLVIAVTVR